MKRATTMVLVTAFSLLGAGAALAQNPNCSDNCGIGVGGGNVYNPPPHGPPAVPPGRGKGGAAADLQPNPELQTAAVMAGAASAVLAGSGVVAKAAPGAGEARQAAVAPAARNLSEILSGAASVASWSPIQSALEGSDAMAQAPAGAFDGSAREPRRPGTSPAQQAAARNLVKALNGLLQPGQKPAQTFTRAAAAARRFNEFVAVAEPSYLQSPPPEFVLVHEVLVRMLEAPEK